MSRIRRMSALAIAAIALVLPACGGDDEKSASDAILAVIEDAATSKDPADCTRLATQNFVEQTQFSEGEAAVESCEAEAPTSAADSVEVSNIQVDGDSATAEAALTGGGLDGQTIELGLVQEGDQWKIDSLESFVEFDRDAFMATLVEDADESNLGQRQLDCIVESLDKVGDEEIQEIFLSGDPEQLLRVFLGCA